MFPVHTIKISMGSMLRARARVAVVHSASTGRPDTQREGSRGTVAERWVDVGDAHSMRRRNRARPVEAARCGILLCNLDGTLYAIADVCTHDGGRLEGGRVRDASVECPRHGARFDVRDGSVRAPPATRPIASYPVRVVGDRVEVLLPDACVNEDAR
jgi:3-phenylpropionate/trans-cinnamate dioxygenase ferredoxin component